MQKHLIFSLGRSGSNFLANSINKHPQITNYGEVLGEWTVPYKLHKKIGLGGKSMEGYLDFIYQNRLFFYSGHLYSAFSHFKQGKPVNFKTWEQTQSLGVKDFSMNFMCRGLSSYLKNHKEIKVINLYRENILKRLISLEKMKDGGVVKLTTTNSEKQSSAPKKITLDLPYVLSQLEIYERELNDHAQMANELPPEQVLNIRYEDLFLDRDSTNHYLKQVFEFLNVTPINEASDHRKILSDRLPDIIENYDELASTLQDTRFAVFLED